MSTQITSKSSKWAAEMTVRRNGFDVAFGYIDGSGFNVVAPTKTYATEAAARRAAAKWLAR